MAILPLALEAPRPFEATPGVVVGRPPAGADAIEVVVDGRRVRRFVLRAGQKRFAFGPIGLPARDLAIEVRALRDGRPVARRVVHHLFGLPRSAWRLRGPRGTDGGAQRALGALRSQRGVFNAVWSRHLASGYGASYNAGATFPAASTLKLAILLTALSRDPVDPLDSTSWPLYRRLVIESSNAAANAVLVRIGGSTSYGGALVNDFARALGATATDMYGGYLLEPDERAISGAPIPPVAVSEQPSYPRGKHTTAHDLGQLVTALVQAAAGRGPAHGLGVSGREARTALWLLLHARHPGLVGPATDLPVAHKVGYLARLQHDAAVVFAPDGPLVVAVMSDGAGGVSYTASRDWAARVLRVLRQRLSAG